MMETLPPRNRGGRPPGPNPLVPHGSRRLAKGAGTHPIVLKVKKGVALRSAAVVREIDEGLMKGVELGRFRLAGWSLEDDHVHLQVDAEDPDELGRAMKAIAARFARAVNRSLGRSGRVLADRYRILGPAKEGQKILRCGCPAKKPAGAAVARAAPRPRR